MSNSLDSVAVAFARGWVTLYTLGLRKKLREARRAEIESDLFDQRKEAETNEFALGLISRVARGMPADVAWSYEVRGEIGGHPAMTSLDRHRKTQNAVIVAISAGLAALGLLVVGGFSSITWILAGAAMAVALAGLLRLIFGRIEVIDGSGGSRRMRLVAVFLGCVVTLAAVGAYAFSLDEWGEAGSIIFNLVFLLGVAVALGSLVLLITDLFRGDRPVC